MAQYPTRIYKVWNFKPFSAGNYAGTYADYDSAVMACTCKDKSMYSVAPDNIAHSVIQVRDVPQYVQKEAERWQYDLLTVFNLSTEVTNYVLC